MGEQRASAGKGPPPDVLAAGSQAAAPRAVPRSSRMDTLTLVLMLCGAALCCAGAETSARSFRSFRVRFIFFRAFLMSSTAVFLESPVVFATCMRHALYVLDSSYLVRRSDVMQPSINRCTANNKKRIHTLFPLHHLV